MTKKKSYNPFKMWGAYVGAIILFLWKIAVNTDWLRSIELLFGENPLATTVLIKAFLIYLPIGFLVGWGIHSLVRRLKK